MLFVLRRFLAPTLLLYHTSFRLSIGFWKVFWNFLIFFQDLKFSLPLKPDLQRTHLSSHIPLSQPSNSWSLYSTQLRSSRQLWYSTTFFPSCQHLFSNFFTFGHYFNLYNLFRAFLVIIANSVCLTLGIMTVFGFSTAILTFLAPTTLIKSWNTR